MRIISGTYKGKSFQAPKAIKARPTTDFAKEALFSILENKIDIPACTVLDLFSGTGSISYEFASRGAIATTSVDANIASYRFINSNAIDWNMPIKAIKSETFKFLKKVDQTFDIIFADPPYALKKINQLPDAIFESEAAKKAKIIIIEHGQETDYSKHERHLETRVYSRVNFSFFKAFEQEA